MELYDIISSVTSKNNDIPTTFYKECLEKLNAYDQQKIYQIPEDKHILESIRLYLIDNPYNIYVADKNILKKMPNAIYRTYNLTDKGKKNLLSQIFAITKYNINSICHNIFDIKNICCIISDKQIDNLIEIKDLYAATGLLLGVESLKIMEHQDLHRFCTYIEISKKPRKKKPLKEVELEPKKYQYGDIPKIELLEIQESQDLYRFYDYIGMGKKVKSPREIAVNFKKQRECKECDKSKSYAYVYNKFKKILKSTNMYKEFYDVSVRNQEPICKEKKINV